MSKTISTEILCITPIIDMGPKTRYVSFKCYICKQDCLHKIYELLLWYESSRYPNGASNTIEVCTHCMKKIIHDNRSLETTATDV